MATVEFVRAVSNKREYRLFIDGEEVSPSRGSVHGGPDDLWLSLYSHDLSTHLLDDQLAQYVGNYERISLRQEFGWTNLISEVDFYPQTSDEWLKWRVAFSGPAMRFGFTYDIEGWKQLWSITEFSAAMHLATERHQDSNIQWVQEDNEVVANGCGLYFKLNGVDHTLRHLLAMHEPIVQSIYQDAIGELVQQVRPEAIVASFRLPPEVRVACEQYLLYFVQFLRDLGIDATGELTEQAGQVLFAVTPQSGPEALHRIRQALQIYLQLPSHPEIGTYQMPESDIGVQRLEANILHLRSQLQLANATIQTNQATIQALQVTTTMQQIMLPDGGLSSSVRHFGRTPAADKETLLDGIVSLTAWEGRGFVLHLPEIYRRLRRLLAGKDPAG